jgi:hypothetical protein
VERRLAEFITTYEVRQSELESQKLDLYQQLQARAIEAESRQAEITKLTETLEGAMEKMALLEGQLRHCKAIQQESIMRLGGVCSTVEKHQSELKKWSDWDRKGDWKDSHRDW